ncbi:hypothetical protein [Hydrogenophaga sp.]|jgi:hypothetical protein|uniref:hypothetical protein n=1 Tax=Hydrogenophaga sp. TaxID=1904254 RepID=UPI002720C69D|nr:hypothetical protein [Hydrogenophaga sp.]MDO9252156.1 hypothetical protein [Hydrogenophaga sp.]MDP2408479.1 hypothetical protein [Hydrogenophaga sp.]MDP3324728.1 hypothetical protein [Hydrogenophaga sp.]MDP3886786.1 hypothetical protein [Hydrogenophaga sp.]MDZ4174248.1 hypothetical protein [Hydrogenophaga sp.]
MPRHPLPDPHDYPSARRGAERLRREALDDFWRGADAAWARIQLDAGARLVRSTQRLQARLRALRRAHAPAETHGQLQPESRSENLAGDQRKAFLNTCLKG